MRKNFGTKSWFYPLPVLIIATFNEDGTADAMNAAWGGTRWCSASVQDIRQPKIFKREGHLPSALRMPRM